MLCNVRIYLKLFSRLDADREIYNNSLSRANFLSKRINFCLRSRKHTFNFPETDLARNKD